VKLYAAAMEAVTEKQKTDETQLTTKIDGFFLSFTPFNANVLTPCTTKLRVLMLSFPYFKETLMCHPQG
jgi:hypothetical protein